MKTMNTLLLGLALAAITGANAQSGTTISNTSNDSTGQLLAMADVSNISISAAYPGPVISDVHVDIASAVETNATIRLINNVGRTELEKPVRLINGENHFDISMNDMSGGEYQLIVQTDTKRVGYKLVKAR